MKKISSLVVLFVMLVASFALLFGNSVKSYSKASYKTAIENAIKPLDTPKVPTGSKPVPKQPPKNQQPPGGGRGSEKDPNPPGTPPGPCSCGHAPGTGSG
jgi:hypothetical protein